MVFACIVCLIPKTYLLWGLCLFAVCWESCIRVTAALLLFLLLCGLAAISLDLLLLLRLHGRLLTNHWYWCKCRTFLRLLAFLFWDTDV